MHEFMIALRSLAVFTLLTGVAYPLLVTGLGQIANADAAQGSLLKRGDTAVGSFWLAQPFQQPGYFWPRPSAGDFATVASGASNKGPTSKDLLAQIQSRKTALLKAHHLPEHAAVPPELLLASGSGLDPHLSLMAVTFQLERVSQARGLNPQAVEALIQTQLEAPQFKILGAPRINVLALNLALDRQFGPQRGQD